VQQVTPQYPLKMPVASAKLVGDWCCKEVQAVWVKLMLMLQELEERFFWQQVKAGLHPAIGQLELEATWCWMLVPQVPMQLAVVLVLLAR
jgi:hypothetical protein